MCFQTIVNRGGLTIAQHFSACSHCVHLCCCRLSLHRLIKDVAYRYLFHTRLSISRAGLSEYFTHLIVSWLRHRALSSPPFSYRHYTTIHSSQSREYLSLEPRS